MPHVNSSALIPTFILKERVKNAEKAAARTFRALVKAEEKATEISCYEVEEATQEANECALRCEREWDAEMETLKEATEALEEAEAMMFPQLSSKVTSVTKPRQSGGPDRCGRRRKHKKSGNDYITTHPECPPGSCYRKNNLIQKGQPVVFHFIEFDDCPF